MRRWLPALLLSLAVLTGTGHLNKMGVSEMFETGLVTHQAEREAAMPSGCPMDGSCPLWSEAGRDQFDVAPLEGLPVVPMLVFCLFLIFFIPAAASSASVIVLAVATDTGPPALASVIKRE